MLLPTGGSAETEVMVGHALTVELTVTLPEALGRLQVNEIPTVALVLATTLKGAEEPVQVEPPLPASFAERLKV
jgi:hypothetical protein